MRVLWLTGGVLLVAGLISSLHRPRLEPVTVYEPITEESPRAQTVSREQAPHPESKETAAAVTNPGPTMEMPADPPEPLRLVQRRPVGGMPPGLPEPSQGHDRQHDRQQARLHVDRIVTEQPADYRERLAAIHALRMETLDDTQIRRLLAYLETPDRENGLPGHLFHVLVNELLAFFHKQERIDSRYLESSFRIIDDDRQDEVVRDYTLQGLSHAMDKAAPGQAQQIEAFFWENTRRTHVSLAGTSLLALNRLQQEERLTPEATERLQDLVREYLHAAESPGEPTRIVSLQIAARQNLRHTLEPAKAALRAGDLTPSETIAVLGLLAHFQDPDFPAWLEHFQTASHPILRQSAQRMAATPLTP